MAEHEQTQPATVAKALANYRDMTAPRTRAPHPRPRQRPQQEPPTRPVIDNRGLDLEEGNDFA